MYSWAGQFRTVNISKGGRLFGVAAFVESVLDDTLRKLSLENHLTGLTRAAFAQRAGYYLGEINAIHPFRDGNGRTQREFIRQLGLGCGHQLLWSRISREQLLDASIKSFTVGDNTELAAVIATCMKMNP